MNWRGAVTFSANPIARREFELASLRGPSCRTGSTSADVQVLLSYLVLRLQAELLCFLNLATKPTAIADLIHDRNSNKDFCHRRQSVRSALVEEH